MSISKVLRSFSPVQFRRSRHHGQRALSARRPAVLPILETLEQRLLMSVSAATLLGRYLTPGTHITVSTTDNSSSEYSTDTIDVIGTATAPGGQTAVKVRDVFDGSTGPVTVTLYCALTGDGYIQYAQIFQDDQDTLSDVVSPFTVLLPATMTAGQNYISYYSEAQTDSEGTTAADFTRTITLDSETPQALTVPAGTFKAYKVTVTDVSDEENLLQTMYYAPGIGLIKAVGEYETTVVTSISGGDSLAFSPQPTGAAINHSLPTVTVTLRNAKGAIDTASSAAVTLTLNAVKSAGSANLSGTTTVAAVNGIATFSDLKIDAAGTYTFSASSSETSKPVTSKAFTVSHDHLVFTKQPGPVDINAPIVFTVAAQTEKNKIDTSVNDRVLISLNTITGGLNATLGGTTLLTFVNGVATFTTAAAPQIAIPGKYTLTATAVKPDGHTANATFDVGTSKALTVTGFHLVFTQQPKNGDIKSPLSFQIAVENSKNKIQTQVNAEILVSLNALKAAHAGTLSGDTSVTLVNGIATYTSTQDDEINEPGTYTLTAVEEPLPPMGAAAAQNTSLPMVVPQTATTASATSKAFTLKGYHLAILQQPQDTSLKQPVLFQVALLNAENKVVTTEDASYRIDVAQWNSKEGVTESKMTYQPMPLVNGIATFTASPGVRFTLPATYKILIGELTHVGATPDLDVYADYTQGFWTKPFKVHGYHLVVTEQPVFAFVGEPLTFQVALEDFKNQVVTADDGKYVDVTHVFVSQGGPDGGQSNPPVKLLNGYASFTAATPVTFAYAGTYFLELSELSTIGESRADDVFVTTTKTAKTNHFRISAG